MSAETIYLIEATDSTGTVHRFCTGRGYTSLPSDTPANAHYSPRVEQPGLFRQNMFDTGTTSGSSSGGYGEITLLNTDGGLDSFIDLGFDGQALVAKEGLQGAALSQFATVITGTVEQLEVSWNRVTFRLKDKTALLNVPAQTVLYLGNNVLPAGREGGEELQDKPKPRLFGVCNNVTPICVNTSKLIYQVNSGAVYDIPAVHDGGNVGQITKGADYATGALLEAATVPAVTNPATPPAQYMTCLAEGLFRLDAAPFMQLTCDVIQGATAADRTAGQIIKTLATEKLGAAFVAAQPIIDLDKAAPYTVGIYTGDADITTAELLDQLCASVGAWWGFDNLGIFWAKQLTAPVSSQAVMTLTQAEILSIDRQATADGDKGVPVWRVNVDYAKNWTVQTSGLAGSVAGNQLVFAPDAVTPMTADRMNLLSMEYRRVKAEDAAVKTTHLLAAEITRKTLLSSATDAGTEAARELTLRKVRRDRLRVRIPQQIVQYPAGGYWDDEAISEMSIARSGHGCAVGQNYVYVAGGSIAAPTFYTANVTRLDLSNPAGAWDDAGVTDLPTSLRDMPMVSDGNYLYVIGGASFSTLSAKVYRLDLSNPTGAWDDAGITDLPAAMSRMGACIYNGFLYVAGGQLSGAANSVATVRRLDLSNPTGAWDDAGVTDLPVGKRSAYVTLCGSKLVVGGGLDNSSNLTSSVHYLDLSNPAGAWQTYPNLPQINSSGSAVSLGNYVYFIGGSNNAKRVIRLDTANPLVWDDEGVADLPAESTSSGLFAYGSTIYLTGSNVFGTPTGNSLRLRTNSNPDDASQRTGLGRTILVKYPRYGYTAGRPMKIIGAESDSKNRTITLELWG